MITLYIYLSVFAVFFFLGVPVVLSLAISALYLLISNDVSLTVFAQQWLKSTDNFSLTAIFFFMLAGEIMNVGGLTKRIVGIACKLVGKTPGGLAIMVGLGSMIFAAVNGSAIATAVAIGSVMIPAMVKENYSAEFSGATVATGGVIGPIIPPSIPLILYGTVTGLSIAKLFAGGAGLGLLMGTTIFIMSYIISKKRGYRGGDHSKEFSSKGSLWAVLLPVFLFVTITFGILTATESSAFAVLYAFIITKYVYKELKLSDLPILIKKSFINTALVMAIVGAASVVAWILASHQIPQMVAKSIIEVVDTRIQFMLLTFLILILVGTVMDLTPAILILAPVFIEPARLMGIDPVYFGVFFVATLVVGLITPPVGTLIFTSCSMTDRSFSQIGKELTPFTIALLVIILISIFIPQIILFIPNLIW